MKLKAITKDILPKTLGLVGGAIAADFIDQPLSGMNGYLRNGAKIVLGAALSAMTKNKILQGVGDGMIAVGGVGIFKEIVPGTTTPPATSGLGFTDSAIGEDWQPSYPNEMSGMGATMDNAIGTVDEIGGGDDII